MAPLIVLVAVTALARLAGLFVQPLNDWSVATAIGLAAIFVMTSITHFVQPRRRGLIAIVPPVFARPDILVSITGALEFVGAIGLLVPVTRVAAAVCLALLLLALFPANVYAAGAQRHSDSPHTPLVPRTLYQLVFLAACVVVVVGI